MKPRIVSPQLLFACAGLFCLSTENARGETADHVTKLIDRLIQLDSIDLAKDVKFRAGLEPSLFDLDADESKMTVLKNPYRSAGARTNRGRPGGIASASSCPKSSASSRCPRAATTSASRAT